MKCNIFIKSIVLFIALFVVLTVNAQSSIKDSIISMGIVSVNAGFQIPGGDLADRFGNSSSIGGAYEYKNQNNWTYSLEGGFIFGQKVKIPVAIDIRTSSGEILDDEGAFVDLLLLQRGFLINAAMAKTLPIIGPNPNSGLHLKLGVGLLQHKILLETRKNEVNVLEGDFRKGYDRLTNGLMLQQFVGYRHLSNNKRINFTVGFEVIEGFTQSRRDFNFDLGK
ncbi:MAG: hypothetical protein ACI8XB_003206, partial [Patiriisocius sp.]